MGGTVIGISTDKWEEIPFRLEQERQGIIFVADPDMEIISAFGLEDVCLEKEIARPASFLLDAQGTIRWRHLPTDWRLRTSGDEYLALFERLNAPLMVQP